MIKKLKIMMGAFVVVGALAIVGWWSPPNDDVYIPGPTKFGKTVQISDGSFYLGGTQVTATAAILNGVTTNTVSLYTNATLSIYGSNLTLVAGGVMTIGSSTGLFVTVTNAAPGVTNVMVFKNGVLTAITRP